MQFVLTFTVLFSFWLIWSGKFDLFHLILGLISTLIVTFWSGDLFFNKKSKTTTTSWISQWIKFEIYSLWLIWEIFLANIHVILVSLSPNPKAIMNPRIFTFKSSLKNEFAQFLLAQSITLTPGTVTVAVDKGTFTVHALTTKTAEGTPGDMEHKIKRIFGAAA